MPRAYSQETEFGPEDDDAPLSADARADGNTADDLDALRRERDDLKARWQRAQADYQNLRRRSQAEFEEASRRAVQGLLENLLLALDNLDLALGAPVTNEETEALAAGVRLTRDQILRALEQEGVAPVPEGSAFDPALHQAIATVAVPGAEPGSVVETTRRGYTWRYGVLRYAQVIVAAGDGRGSTPTHKNPTGSADSDEPDGDDPETRS
jgi:molecular chaperone GrpE